MRGKRANDPRPVFYPDGISNKGWLALRGSLREPESATREVASIRVRDELPMSQAFLQIAELAEADSSLTVTQTPFVVPGPVPPSLLQGRRPQRIAASQYLIGDKIGRASCRERV